MKWVKQILSFLVVLGISASYCQPALAQIDRNMGSVHNVWLNLGIGGSTHGLAGLISMSVQNDIHLITFRYVSSTEFVILGPTPSESVWDISILYGRFWKSRLAMVSISGGLGLVGGIRRGDYIRSDGWFSSKYQKCPFSTVGFPVDIQLFWMPSRFLGFSIQGFANLNSEESFYGFVLGLQVGRLK
jgi:hypothetical protein